MLGPITLAAYVVLASVVVLGAYCVVSALVSRIEDTAADEPVLPASENLSHGETQASDPLRDLPKAA